MKNLYLSTFIFWLATNLVSPFFAIFALERIPGVTITEYGFSTLIYFLSFGLSVILVGRITDNIKGEKDDITIAVTGYITRGILLIVLAYVTSISGLYLIQFLLGVSRSFSDSVKEKLHFKLISQKNIASSFSITSGITNLSAAFGAGLGGYLAGIYGFEMVFIIVGILTIISGIVYGFATKKLI
jgi:MFS family permease